MNFFHLGAPGSGDELGSNPSGSWYARFFGRLNYFPIFILRDSSGYKFPPLFSFRKCGSAYFAWGVAHGFGGKMKK
jgi:hypothetical protein